VLNDPAFEGLAREANLADAEAVFAAYALEVTERYGTVRVRPARLALARAGRISVTYARLPDDGPLVVAATVRPKL